MSPRPVISTERLFAAADALLEAMSRPDGMNTLIDMSLRHATHTAAAGETPFSENELVEAMAMLIRMGLVGPGRQAEH
ncbi:MAG: hypothetical protein K2Q20_01240 [Phycisphaerales bacterium]|nr:hypothetical protein [Phycisphaerales bacterium]